MRRAGVRVFMVTGDFKLTAVAIAQQVGIVTTSRTHTLEELRGQTAAFERFGSAAPPAVKPTEDDPIYSLIVEGAEIPSITAQEWNVIVGYYKEIVFARTTPEQKVNFRSFSGGRLLIVEEVKARGDNTVAVTGDGVNDAPALKAADIGVAMGAGSDVAKEAAAIILLNNDFASIPVAIENGRLVFDNLKKVILYLMPVGSYTEFMSVLANAFFGMQPALSSYLQVMFSVGNDVPMSIGLMYEKAEADLMLRRPRNARTDRLTDWRFFVQIYLFNGVFGWLAAMGMWFWFWSTEARNSNGALVPLGFTDLIFVFDKWPSNTSDLVTVWPIGHGMDASDLANNVNIGGSIYYVTMVIIQIKGALAGTEMATDPPSLSWPLVAIFNLYVVAIQNTFGTAPIPTKHWFIPFGFGAAALFLDEVRKYFVRAYPNSFVAKAAW
ncbi:HAD-like domain-containing protein [Blyttiomyces helicus]|uniref:HAD-like domain-containing protein n=1 Tax=Blyttiomyces helicus TaxID=388810 RepID=A0A4P9W3B9_9FUNG|nr:HAD-like domain-containing protein [Blyttiomyces helicus]|eukprot:RKO85268.1 HAD-like domain-containing protein [Blyttiomyces helicus]